MVILISQFYIVQISEDVVIKAGIFPLLLMNILLKIPSNVTIIMKYLKVLIFKILIIVRGADIDEPQIQESILYNSRYYHL